MGDTKFEFITREEVETWIQPSNRAAFQTEVTEMLKVVHAAVRERAKQVGSPFKTQTIHLPIQSFAAHPVFGKYRVDELDRVFVSVRSVARDFNIPRATIAGSGSYLNVSDGSGPAIVFVIQIE